MEIYLPVEIPITLFFQSLGAWLAPVMSFISLFGTEAIYLAVVSLVYWCIDSTLGLRLAVLLLVSNSVNHTLKEAFHSPRPYWVSSQVKAYAAETSFGLPSGHAQISSAVWGRLACSLKNRGRALVWLLVLLIGISRIYLGVHFTSDVLVGWAIGVFILLLFLRYEQILFDWFKRLAWKYQVLSCLVIAALFVAVPMAVHASASAWPVPVEWADQALAAYPGNVINPFDPSGPFTIGGTWLGMSLGAVWLFHRGQLPKRPSPRNGVLRYLLGFAGILVLWLGLGSLFPHTADVLGLALRLLRYFLVGLWVSALAPLVFRALKWV